MDQVRTGRLIAELRHQRSLTQQELGELLGVTNKTISRWENGNYMPDIEMLRLLSQTFQISMEELLAGERQTHHPHEEPPVMNAAAKEPSIFSPAEQKAYWRKKWRQEHRGLLLLLLAMPLGMIGVCLLIRQPWWIGLVPLVAFAAYGYQNNRMMTYVENKLFPPEE